MADFYFHRGDTTVIVLHVPKGVWDRFEAKHKHFGEAIHNVRNFVTDYLVASAHAWDPKHPDPFWQEPE